MTATQKELYLQRFRPRSEIAPHMVAGVSMNNA